MTRSSISAMSARTRSASPRPARTARSSAAATAQSPDAPIQPYWALLTRARADFMRLVSSGPFGTTSSTSFSSHLPSAPANSPSVPKNFAAGPPAWCGGAGHIATGTAWSALRTTM